jgi:Protein of unknown function (DUF3604)
VTTAPTATSNTALASLRDGCAAYLDILDAGLTDPFADQLMGSVVGVSLSTLTEDAVTRVAATCTELVATRERRLSQPPSGPTLTAEHVVTADTNAYAPAASRGSGDRHAGASWVSWLAYGRDEGDQLTVAGASTGPLRVGSPGSVVNRHVVDGDDRQAWVVTSRRQGQHWVLEAVHVVDGIAGPPEAVADAHAVNPEVCVGPDGTVHVVYQHVAEGRFVVMHLERTEAGWGSPTQLSSSTETAWDPSLAAVDGTLTVVWSVHRDSRFRLCVRQRLGDQWADEQVAPLGADGHALHASVSVGSDGGWWVVCDVIAAETLATSGRTAAVPAEALRGEGSHQLIPAYDLTTRVEVLRLDDGGWSRPAGDPVTERSSGSYPRVVEDGSGRLWLGYRTLRQLPFRHYVSHVAIRAHEGTGWSEPTLAPVSDGTNAEFALVAGAQDVTAVYHGDGHQQRFRAMLADPEDAKEQLGDDTPESVRREHLQLPALDRMSTGGHLGHGQVRAATFTSQATGRPSLVAADSRQTSTPSTRPSPVGWAPPSPDGSAANQLWWGDLHRHSNISRCGAGLDIGVDDHYRLAEDVLGCDFWALTDHAENTSDLNWHHLRKLANAFYRPGAHVPLIGFEWTSFSAGHMNVIFAGDDGPLLSSSDPQTATPEGLWRALERHDALTIPHHPAALVYATDWSYHSERFLRVVEVFQAATGSYESPWCPRQYQDAVAAGSSVQEALSRGHRLGFIASTDHRSGAAFVGLYAPALDRAAIHAALTDRRCFGATRRGIVPHLRVGAAWPGQSTSLDEALAGGGLRFAGSGIGTLSTVQLLRDGEVIADARPQTTPDGDLVAAMDVRMLSREGGQRDWSGTLRAGDGARVEQASHWAPEVTQVSPSVVTWAVELPARYGGRFLAPGVVNLGVTVSGRPDATIEVTAGGRSVRATLAELAAQTGGRCLTDAAAREELAVRSGVGGYGSLGATEWEGTAEPDLLRSGSWYTTRVIQSDGEMAWSSPIWVD